MPGPPPKDPALLVRRNKVVTRATLPSAPAARKRPLSTRTPGRARWLPETRREWDAWWASPQASQWTQIHATGLFRLIIIVNDFWSASTAKERKEIQGEIRLWGVEFGLTLKAERTLQLGRIHEADEGARRERAAPPAPPPSGDPRLRLVKPA